jgi:hypothetical protein
METFLVSLEEVHILLEPLGQASFFVSETLSSVLLCQVFPSEKKSNLKLKINNQSWNRSIFNLINHNSHSLTKLREYFSQLLYCTCIESYITHFSMLNY